MAVLVGLESMGVPSPGETALIAAGVVAAGGDLSIIGVLAASSAGGIIGDNLGFWIGRELGFRLLCRYGHFIHVGPKRLKLLQYMFLRYGRRIVFIGRFVMYLRAAEAFLAGANWMTWHRFFVANAAAVILWSCAWGLSAYALGHTTTSTIEWVSAGVSVVIFGVIIWSYIYFRYHEDELESKADDALPGPLRPRGENRDALQTGHD